MIDEKFETTIMLTISNIIRKIETDEKLTIYEQIRDSVYARKDEIATVMISFLLENPKVTAASYTKFPGESDGLKIDTALGSIKFCHPGSVLIKSQNKASEATSIIKLASLLQLPGRHHNFEHWYGPNQNLASTDPNTKIPDVTIKAIRFKAESVSGASFSAHIDGSSAFEILWEQEFINKPKIGLSIEISSSYTKLMWNAKNYL